MNNRFHGLCVVLAIVLITLPSSRHAAAGANETPKTRRLAPPLPTAQGSLDLSGVALKKGDSREEVMRKLRQLYELQRLRSAQGEEDSWLISEKEQTDNYIGVVSFEGDKVRRVARFRKWTQDDDSVELAQRLCDLLEKLTAERGHQANIEARSTDSGTVSVRGVELVFGDKRVSFNIVSRNDTDSKQKEVHLDEVIQ